MHRVAIALWLLIILLMVLWLQGVISIMTSKTKVFISKLNRLLMEETLACRTFHIRILIFPAISIRRTISTLGLQEHHNNKDGIFNPLLFNHIAILNTEFIRWLTQICCSLAITKHQPTGNYHIFYIKVRPIQDLTLSLITLLITTFSNNLTKPDIYTNKYI